MCKDNPTPSAHSESIEAYEDFLRATFTGFFRANPEQSTEAAIEIALERAMAMHGAILDRVVATQVNEARIDEMKRIANDPGAWCEKTEGQTKYQAKDRIKELQSLQTRGSHGE